MHSGFNFSPLPWLRYGIECDIKIEVYAVTGLPPLRQCLVCEWRHNTIVNKDRVFMVVILFHYQEDILRLWGNGLFFFCAAVYHENWSQSRDFRLKFLRSLSCRSSASEPCQLIAGFHIHLGSSGFLNVNVLLGSFSCILQSCSNNLKLSALTTIITSFWLFTGKSSW